MSGLCDVAIIGAGPYGLSIAAHLRRRGVGFRIFGTPMLNWIDKMPRGMQLKSDGFASNLSDPDRALSLKEFSRQQGLDYADEGLPVPIENFIAYGQAFQQRFVPEVEARRVTGLGHTGGRFAVQLDDGEIVSAGKVVVAVGISSFPWLPPEFSGLPQAFASHASDHAVMDRFAGREVAIVGAGSSAIDIATLMHEAGAAVQLIARRPRLKFHTRTELGGRSWFERLRAPNTGIGPGWRSVFHVGAPLAFRLLPERRRLDAVRQSYGPAGGWYMVERVAKVPKHEGWAVQQASVKGGRIHLDLAGAYGNRKTVSADHAIFCTGYRVDLRKLSFLDDGLRAAIRQAEHTPVLSSRFETSVPGLYFVGPASANSFGPLFRFVHGTRFTAARIVPHLAGERLRRPAPARPALAG